jgi:hypothetical protein
MEGHWDDVEGHQARHWVASKKCSGTLDNVKKHHFKILHLTYMCIICVLHT